ncbi:hypothetical protein SBFV2_gp32 [Sulfolobales Beppu filamentous virus 2]|uniref:Uncharacterized protein n=1 Tax=Sulfolobales Beppu filamentous virus 2 TaxID=2493123 RepID=A0A3S8NES1_9VIRU|nr:hypothetical protein HOU84_gp32 [Sulfolobales Beppu filamentous virus 2]AZI75799.1 hypothetical protein SBFV2_gp32 [Sulfolobales Beppu filamentous virus 2]
MKKDYNYDTFVVKLKIEDRIELDDVMRRLGYSTRHSFFVDVIRGILTAIDGNDRDTLFVFVPIPKSLVLKYLEKNISLQELILKILLEKL